MARVAFVSPLPPAETGIATYSDTVLQALEAAGGHDVEPIWPIRADALDRVRAADVAIYHMGNNAHFHAAIYRLVVEVPGIVVLHDIALDDMVRTMGRDGEPLGVSAMSEARAAGRVTRRATGGSEALALPWCANLVRHARRVIVHSEFARSYVEAAGCRTPVDVVPHPLMETEAALQAARELGEGLRADLAGRRDVPEFDVLVGVLGDLSGAKGIEAILEALPMIQARVHLLLVGRTGSGWDVVGAVRRGPYGDRVTIATDVADDEFLAWLCASDVVVNLRHPHRGEVSGSLIRAMQAGVPAVVSATGTYLEWPADAAVRVSPGPPRSEEVATTLTLLAANAEIRRFVGDRARAFVTETCDPGRTAAGYERAIDDTLSMLRDPTRRAVARWADALAECGGTLETARRGMGTRFPVELATLGEPA